MENQQNKVYNMFNKVKKICISNTTIHLSSSLLLFMNFWVMAQENYTINYQIFHHLSMVNNLQLTTKKIKHGIVYLVRQLQHMKNAKLIVQHFIFQFLKMFKKLYYQSIQKSKDGILFTQHGLIQFKEELKDLNTMMLSMINGFKPILVLHMLF